MKKFEWRPDPDYRDGTVWELYVEGVRRRYAYVGRNSLQHGFNVFASRSSYYPESAEYLGLYFADLREAAKWVEEGQV